LPVLAGAAAFAAVAFVASGDESPPGLLEGDDVPRSTPVRFVLRRPIAAVRSSPPRKKSIRVGLLGAMGEPLTLPAEPSSELATPDGNISREARTVVTNRRVALTISGPDRFLAAELRELLWRDDDGEQCAASRAVQPLAPLEVQVAPNGAVISVSSDALELSCEREVLRRSSLPITPEGFTFRLRWSRRWP
jgi:hypothetical protein